MVPNVRTRGHRHKLKHSRLHLNIICFFIVRVIKHWHRGLWLPGKAVESSSFKILKSCLDTDLGNQLWMALLKQRVLR